MEEEIKSGADEACAPEAEKAEAAPEAETEVKEETEAKEETEPAEAAGSPQKKHEKEKDGKKRRERELESKLAEAEKKLAEADDKYMRLAAEYDNYRRRSRAEREGVYGEAYAEALGKLLPTLDNLDRASQYQDPEKLADGVKLILKGLPDLLASLGVETFGEPGDKFDPAMHSAVATVEDAEVEPGHIAAVFQKGYRRGEKILRYAAVTVASEG